MLAITIVPTSQVSTAPRGPFFSRSVGSSYLEDHYWPRFANLFLHEGSSSTYPMPAANEVPDLLTALKGTKGIAVNTNPGTTVTEGQGYAMFVAGMRNDTETLKRLTVAWQANGQGVAGVPACGGCGLNYDSHVDAASVCSGEVVLPEGVLCKTVPGAYMPGWEVRPPTERRDRSRCARSDGPLF
jgi:hypothetical protein